MLPLLEVKLLGSTSNQNVFGRLLEKAHQVIGWYLKRTIRTNYQPNHLNRRIEIRYLRRKLLQMEIWMVKKSQISKEHLLERNHQETIMVFQETWLRFQ